MAVFRIEKTRDYTVMSNYHLKDRTLTLKSKGLLSMISPRRARSPVVMCRSRTAYEPKQEVAAGMGVLPGRERQAAV